MLSEEALVLIGAFIAFGLLVLGVLELMAPTRSRHPRRPGGGGDERRQARGAPTPVPRRQEPPPLPTLAPLRDTATSTSVGAPASPFSRPAAPPIESPPAESPPAEPPIERLLRSQAASLDPPRRLPPPQPIPRSPASAAAAAPPPEPPGPVEEQSPAEASTIRISEPAGVAPPTEPEIEVIEPGPIEIFEPLPAASEVVTTPPVAAPPARPAPRPAASPSDKIYALWESKQHAVVEREATAALERGGLPAGETARLWGLIGLARQEQGDVDGARAAFEEAINAAPVEDRPAWQRHMAQLALHAGQALVARVQSGAGDPNERIDALRAAIGWFESGIGVAAGDETLRDAVTAARAALWPTYEEAATALLQRQEFHVARRLLLEAQADAECPPTVQASLREMLAATFGGEVGQLTADAIRRMQEGKEEECLAALDRAETLLATIPDEGMPAKRRQELERRLWWGYTKLGIRRVDGGMWEESLEPLVRALGFQGVGADRQEETRGPLVRALEGVVDARTPLIQRLTDDGDRDGALLLCEKLWAFLKTAMDRGISKDELAPALAKTQQLFERLGKRKS